MMNEELLNELLEKPVGPEIAKRETKGEDFTREVVISKNTAEIEAKIDPENVNEGTALQFLQDEGLTPEEWEVTHFRKIEYGQGLRSVRFSYKRVQGVVREPLVADELLGVLEGHDVAVVPPAGRYGFLVLIGDMQFGKIDGDGAAGTLRRTVECINKAADVLEQYRKVYDIGHVHVAWLGDHIEGFVSQGGANVWRTNLTLNEQIRLTQAVMLHALKTFAPLAAKVTMAAVPGNHGETVRFEGTGLTRYDDSHDTEALISVHNTIKSLEIPGFEHVEFFVPDTDELIVVTEVAGTVIAHHHGHKWRPNKHFEWWAGQAFNRDSAMHVADLLVSGHLHHEHIEADGDRLFIGVPAMEAESTWFKHTKGTGGSPGLIVALTKDGRTPIKHTVNFTDADTQKGVDK